MKLSTAVSNDYFGVLSCCALIMDVAIFSYVKDYVLFLLALGGAGVIGLALAAVGIGKSIRKKTVPIFSIIGITLSLVPIGITLMAFQLGKMH